MARARAAEDVELNVTAMLDMAFQLLAFFVLTFRPGPVEPGVQLHMPPAQADLQSHGDIVGEKAIDLNRFKLAGIGTLRVDLFSHSGELERMTIDGIPIENSVALRDAMRMYLTAPDTPIERVVIRASECLRYDEVMKIVDVCLKQKLPAKKEFVKLTLVAMEDGA